MKKKNSQGSSSQTSEEQDHAKKHILVNVADTQYPVVKEVCKSYHWKLQHDKQATNWDLCWTDNAVQAETLSRMQAHQKINHFPGMFSLARKNHLARGLTKMKKKFEEYNFFPQTWLLPSEYADLKMNIESKQKGKTRTYIAKPQASCQGRGIFLTRSIDSFQPHEHYVVQRYLSKPLLLQGLKFDMRLYVLVAGCDPLRLYLYKEGLGRLATVPYDGPKTENLHDLCMHLTNYAINKDNENFIFNSDKEDMSVGHKRSLTSVLGELEQEGFNVADMTERIKDIIIKTMIVGQPVLSHHYKACQSVNLANNMCFEILGFDVIADHRGRPMLLEINHTPSFTTDTPLDQHIKENLIKDTLKLMNISVRSRNEIIMAKKQELQQRMITGKKAKLTPAEKKQQVQLLQKIRDRFESKNLGNYQLIYPLDQGQVAKYSEYIEYSNLCYEESTGANIKRNVKKEDEPSKKTITKLSKDEMKRINQKCKQLSMPKIKRVKKETLKAQLQSKMDEQLVGEDCPSVERRGTEDYARTKTSGNYVQPKMFMPSFVTIHKVEPKSLTNISKGTFNHKDIDLILKK